MTAAATSPTVVGRYAIFDRIASGGMATVHLGRLIGEAGFSRTVAIKRLHAQFALDPEFVAMFIDEARLCARIRHPNVVPTLDVVARDGELFLVMEYVEGESLGSLLQLAGARPEKPPFGHVASIMAGVLHGLHAAHEAKGEDGKPLGIVHRDVSPQNILVGVDGTARVLDFGIAKALGQLHTTREGAMKGKMAYMAPEQIEGGAVTRRTDLFAASVVLWEALAARRLFRAENDARRMHMILHAPIPDLRETAPDVPEALAQVVMRGLSRAPEQRYATALEMVEALEAAINPSTPRAVGTWVRALSEERLANRAAVVSEMESQSHAQARTAGAPPSDPPVYDDPTFLQEPGSQVSSISVSGPSSRPERSRLSRRRVQVLAGVAALGAVIAVGAALSGRHGSTLDAPSAASHAPPPAARPADTPAQPQPQLSAAALPSSAPEESAAPTASTSPPAVAQPSPTHAPAAPARKHPPPPPPAATPNKPIYSRD